MCKYCSFGIAPLSGNLNTHAHSYTQNYHNQRFIKTVQYNMPFWCIGSRLPKENVQWVKNDFS